MPAPAPSRLAFQFQNDLSESIASSHARANSMSQRHPGRSLSAVPWAESWSRTARGESRCSASIRRLFPFRLQVSAACRQRRKDRIGRCPLLQSLLPPRAPCLSSPPSTPTELPVSSASFASFDKTFCYLFVSPFSLRYTLDSAL